MEIACNIACIVCSPSIGPGPNDPNNPFVNLSSESPDADTFFGRGYSVGNPPLGSEWLTSSCLGMCISTVSQEAADQCAAAAAVVCISAQWPITTINTNGDPVTQDRPIFYSFPQSCAFQCPDGSYFNFTTVGGLYTSAINQASADAQAYSWACEKAAINFVCLSALSVTRACEGVAYSGSIGCTSVHTPLTFAVTGALPPGLTSNVDASGTFLQITGTPTAFGSYSFHLVVTDNIGNTMAKDYTINIVGIATTSLSDGINGTAYSETLVYGGTATGAVAWSVTAGILPIGLSLNSATGEISGTPTVDGVYGFTIRATDPAISCSKAFTITVATSSALAFSDLAWSVLIPSSDPAFYDIIAPDSLPNNFNCFCIGAGPATASSVGSLSYTGPLVACNLNVSVSNWAPEFLGSSVPSIPIVIQVNAVTVLTIEAYTDCPGVGVYNFPFNVPLSVAAPITVSVQVNRVDVGGFQGQFNAEFTLTP